MFSILSMLNIYFNVVVNRCLKFQLTKLGLTLKMRAGRQLSFKSKNRINSDLI